MKRLLLMGALLALLLAAFVGSALADGPYSYGMSYGGQGYGGYGGYGGGYGSGYGMGYGGMKYGGYNPYSYYPTYSKCCYQMVYQPCPYKNSGYMQNYGYGGYSGYGMMSYGGYGGYNMMSYGGGSGY